MKDAVWYCGCGELHWYEPPQTMEVPIKIGRLTDSQLEAVRKFQSGAELSHNEKKRLKTAMWRLVHPEQWWKGRGRESDPDERD